MGIRNEDVKIKLAFSSCNAVCTFVIAFFSGHSAFETFPPEKTSEKVEGHAAFNSLDIRSFSTDLRISKIIFPFL